MEDEDARHPPGARAPETPEQTATAPTEELTGLMQELRVVYMTEFPNVLSQMQALVTDGDAAGLGAIGHRLKGNGASYGFPEIQLGLPRLWRR